MKNMNLTFLLQYKHALCGALSIAGCVFNGTEFSIKLFACGYRMLLKENNSKLSNSEFR